MNDPRSISILDYTYSLPDNRIAHYPLEKRDDSKLLVYKDGHIVEDVYRNMANHLPEGSLLVFNNTRVVEARLVFQKPTGGSIEIFCLEPDDRYADTTTALTKTGQVFWKCLVGGASKWKNGQVLEKKIKAGEEEIVLQAYYVEKKTDHFIIELRWTPSVHPFAEILQYTGAIPLPPYIKRASEQSDTERYQTIYAQHDGSVAAPTAGLHFTSELFEKLDQKKISRDFVTLHVGAGTFKPVKAARMEDHAMHTEFIDLHIDVITHIRTCLNKPVVAVGTTSLRTIESLYWLGVKISNDPELIPSAVQLHQWDAYDLSTLHITAADALDALINWMKRQGTERLLTKTQIIIAPGYQFRIVDALITNFHQPQSTLLLLVAAMVGDEWSTIYTYALENEFRFLSYGDGSLLWVHQP